MNRLLIVLLVLASTAEAFAQQRAPLLTSQRQRIQITTSVLYQRYMEDDAEIAELSFPLFISMPLGRRMGISLLASQATASGDGLETVTGFDDVQVTLSYARRLGRSSLVLNVGTNLPSGKHGLTQGEFDTVVPLSFNFYDFQVAGFGQGLSVSPGVTWAIPLSDDFVLGVGASYLYRQGFEPLEGMEDSFTPGNEILLTGGVDLRLSRRAVLAGDVTYTLYEEDEVGDVAVFGAGSKTTATVQFKHYQGFNELRLVGRYRGRAPSEVLSDSVLVTQPERALPNEFEVRATYTRRLSSVVTAGFLLGGRYFEETPLFAEKQLLDVGLMPDVRLSHVLSLTTRFIYTLGTFEGFEAGGGLALHL